nr:SHOCT domain-containing protein [Sphingomonas sp. CROZ-RG-20F-R02-07]
MPAITIAFVSFMAAVPSAAISAERVATPEPSSKPDWTVVRKNTELALKTDLFDPEAAQFTWTSGFAWSYIKPALKPHMWAWVGCVSINAKNRLGGYVGAEPRYAAYTTAGNLLVGRADWAVSQCSKPGMFPVQPELMAAASPVTQTAADQLSQLASLLDRGLITRAEFDSQKAALLGSHLAPAPK